MAENENINKVVFGNQTLLDLTEDSVSENNLLEGETAHDRSGSPITGTAKQGHVIKNQSGTAMTQRATLQFKGLDVSDDSEGSKTVVEHKINNDAPTFTEASTRANIASGETIATLFGKIKKWFTDLPSMFVSKSGGTISGDLTVDRQNGTTSGVGWGLLTVGNSTPSGTAGNAQGLIDVYSNTAYKSQLIASSLTSNRVLTLPNKSGTLAVTDDIPTNNNQLTNGAGYITASGSCHYADYAGYVQLGDGIPLIYSESGDINFRYYQVDGQSVGYYSLKSIISGIDGKVNKSGDTMSGNLTPATNKGASLGASDKLWYSNYLYRIRGCASIDRSIDDSKRITIPNKSGTMALTSDIPSSLPANGGNSDTVDGMHGWELTTLNDQGGSHGRSYYLYCQFKSSNGRFKIKVANGYESKVSVDSLEYTGTATSCFTVNQTDDSFMGRSGWASYLICNHGDGATYYSQTIALPFDSTPIYRRLSGGSDSGWKDFITQENISSYPIFSKYPSGGNDVSKCNLFLTSSGNNMMPSIGFYYPGASYAAIIYMTTSGEIWCRWHDGHEKRIIAP